MRILVTGSGGFIGKNLLAALKREGYEDILLFDRTKSDRDLEEYCAACDFVFHLAGVNRPKKEREFMEGNSELTGRLISYLEKAGNTCPVLMTSSIQAMLDNPYGRSKRSGEELVFAHCASVGSKAYVYRLPNVFGRWCRPNYNSVVATFCHNIAASLPIQINDPGTVMRLVYIDDVTGEFIGALRGQATPLSSCSIYGSAAEGRSDVKSAVHEEKIYPADGDRFMGVDPIHEVTLGTIASLINEFHASKGQRPAHISGDAFAEGLYDTYMSYADAK